LFRGAWDGEPLPLLVAMPSSVQPSAETLARLQHAYALREELDPAWATRPLRHVDLRGLPGGAEGNRTPDLCSAIAALSHLSYGPVARLFTCVRWRLAVVYEAQAI
jgi:hypothetical protein